MSDYPKLQSILGAAFSVSTGLSDDAQRQMLERSLQNTEWRAAFQKELLTAMTDRQTSWMDLLSNDKYEVCDADSEAEARNIAISLLWEPTFPTQSVPE
jgi:hypothetical protein